MSAATKGQKLAAFIDSFLSQVLPPLYRFGTGDATDTGGRRSGQLDVVVEYPFAPSLPTGTGSPRLYLAEGVAAVVEVKSNVASQWDEALHTAAQLAPLERHFGTQVVIGKNPTSAIPLFVAGYTGWNQLDTVQHHLQDAPNIAGILVIDTGLFVGNAHFDGVTATGPWSLWGLIDSLYRAVSSVQSAVTRPVDYAL